VRERADTDAPAHTTTNAACQANTQADAHANGYADTRAELPVVQHGDAGLLRRHRHHLLDDSGRLLRRHDLQLV
jgi:hypothetical protein